LNINMSIAVYGIYWFKLKDWYAGICGFDAYIGELSVHFLNKGSWILIWNSIYLFLSRIINYTKKLIRGDNIVFSTKLNCKVMSSLKSIGLISNKKIHLYIFAC